MSEEQAVYNAKDRAALCGDIAARIEKAADMLGWRALIADAQEQCPEFLHILRLGARIAAVNNLAEKVKEQVLRCESVLGRQLAAEVIERMSSYPEGNAITLPTSEKSSAAFLCELGERIMRRHGALREAAKMLKGIANGGGSEE